MRVVFMGTPIPAVPSLEAILSAGHEVPLVVTQPDRPTGRSSTRKPSPVKTSAMSHGLRVIQPERVRTSEFLEAVAGARPDVLAVVAYGRMLTRPVLDVARHGGINVHFSLLPAYRGAAPVQWALAHGEVETGVTTFRLDEGLDTGELLACRHVVIAPGEHAPALVARLAAEGAMLLVETLRGIAAGTIRPVAQEHGRASVAPMLTREHGLWDPAWTARALEGRVRGFDPWPGVWASRSGSRLRIAEARALPGETTDAEAGRLLTLDGEGLQLACAAGGVAAIASVQLAGGRAMTAAEAVNGRLVRPGDRLERPEPAA